jgi:lipoate-protein ligase A
MRLYNLGKVPWDESQLIYHVLADLGWEALSLVSPASPYVCIGYHQDVDQEVDVAYCKETGIPIFRRDLGGGAVYLDGDQLFFQVILRQDHPGVPKNREAFYQKFLEPIVDVYRRIGIPASYKPVNDVVVGAKKISGTGVGEIGDCIVFVGNLILDFNYATMSRVLRVPDEKFRDKVFKTLHENLTTIRRELGADAARRWDEEGLNALMAEAFARILGPMEPCGVDGVLREGIQRLRKTMTSEQWLFQGRRRSAGRDVKIRAGVHVVHRIHKARGGLIRADFELMDGKFGIVSISGDFFSYPQDAIGRLERELEGRPVSECRRWVEDFYAREGLETPGIGLEDWLQVLQVTEAKG